MVLLKWGSGFNPVAMDRCPHHIQTHHTNWPSCQHSEQGGQGLNWPGWLYHPRILEGSFWVEGDLHRWGAVYGEDLNSFDPCPSCSVQHTAKQRPSVPRSCQCGTFHPHCIQLKFVKKKFGIIFTLAFSLNELVSQHSKNLGVAENTRLPIFVLWSLSKLMKSKADFSRPDFEFHSV